MYEAAVMKRMCGYKGEWAKQLVGNAVRSPHTREAYLYAIEQQSQLPQGSNPRVNTASTTPKAEERAWNSIADRQLLVRTVERLKVGCGFLTVVYWLYRILRTLTQVKHLSHQFPVLVGLRLKLIQLSFRTRAGKRATV
jgi:hypothetical protein